MKNTSGVTFAISPRNLNSPQMILRESIQPHNAWPAAMFWQGVEMATQVIVTQIEPGPVPSTEAIEQMILREWLEHYIEAGTA